MEKTKKVEYHFQIKSLTKHFFHFLTIFTEIFVLLFLRRLWGQISDILILKNLRVFCQIIVSLSNLTLLFIIKNSLWTLLIWPHIAILAFRQISRIFICFLFLLDTIIRVLESLLNHFRPIFLPDLFYFTLFPSYFLSYFFWLDCFFVKYLIKTLHTKRVQLT